MVTSKFGYNDVKTTLDADIEGFQLWCRATTAVTKKLRVHVFVMTRQLQ